MEISFLQSKILYNEHFSLFFRNSRPSIVHCDHNGIIFNMVTPLPKNAMVLEVDDDWRKGSDNLNIWTFGHDGLLLNTSLGSGHKALAMYPTCSAAIETFAFHPLNPNM